MLRRSFIFLAGLALAVPLATRADPWDDEYDDWSYERPAADGYDVSVDLEASASVNLDTFQGALSPYGEWVVVSNHGRVWRPRVAAGWRPYYYGRWEWTNEGWLWVSDEPWGWAAYHYGRWTYDGYYGWVWVPGYQWAPAWVAWRYSGDVVGWAPLGPGVSVYVSTYPFVDFWWTFVPTVRFVGVPVYNVAYAPTYTRRYFQATSPAPPRPVARPTPGRPTPVPAWGGPAPRAIEQRVGRRIQPVRIVAAPTPGATRLRGNEVEVYRPGGRPAPRQSRPTVTAPPAGGRDGWAPGRREEGRAPAPAFQGGARDRAGPGPVPPGRDRDDRDARPGAVRPPVREWSPRGEAGGRAAPPPREEREDREESRAAPPERRSEPPRGGYAPPPSRPEPRGYAPPPSRSEGRPAPPPQRSDGGGRGASRPAPRER